MKDVKELIDIVDDTLIEAIELDRLDGGRAAPEIGRRNPAVRGA